MRRIPASTLISAVCDRMGWNEEDIGLDAAEFASVRRALSQALAEIEESTWWRDLMRVERRTYRDTYDSTLAYSVGEEVYHAGSDAYYLAIRASTAQAPASPDGDGGWTTNLEYWADATLEPSADDYDAATSYIVGDWVRDPADGAIYQCHTASTGNAPSDTAYWGPVTEFVPAVPWNQVGQNRIGRVRSVNVSDPRVTVAPGPIAWQPRDDGVLTFTLAVTRPWVEFRMPTPRLTGTAWSATQSFDAVPAEETGVVSTVGSGSSTLFAVLGVSALRAITTHQPAELRYLAYLNAAGDGQGGEFVFDATSSTADDSVDYIRPTNIDASDPGRWIRTVNP